MSFKVIRIVSLLDFGGVEQRIKFTVLGLRRKELLSHFQFIVLGNGGSVSDDVKKIGARVSILERRIRIPNFPLIFKLYKIFRIEKPFVIHTSGSEANFHGLIAAYLAGVPVRIGEEIGFPNHGLIWRLVFYFVYRTSTNVISISQSVKKRIVELKEVKENKVDVVYNPVELDEKLIGVNDNLNSNLDENRVKKVFIFVTTCRLVPVKNMNTLIRVFAEVNCFNLDLELRLWIIGDGSERLKLEESAKDLGVEEKIIFWGYRKGVVSFLEKANAFVLPSFSEGFSISLVEAMMTSLPCIVTNQGGPSEIIDDGKTGFLIDPKKSEELKEKMLLLLMMNDYDRVKIGEAAKHSAMKYSVENYLRRLFEVYRLPEGLSKL